MVDALALIAAGRARPRPQEIEGVTYARKIAKEDAHIDFSASADAVDCQVRALLPAPGAYAQILGERCKILWVVPLHDEVHKATPGMVLDERLTIACGRGAVRLVTVQRPGKAPMTAGDLLRGFRVPVGTVLG